MSRSTGSTDTLIKPVVPKDSQNNKDEKKPNVRKGSLVVLEENTSRYFACRDVDPYADLAARVSLRQLAGVIDTENKHYPIVVTEVANYLRNRQITDEATANRIAQTSIVVERSGWGCCDVKSIRFKPPKDLAPDPQ